MELKESVTIVLSQVGFDFRFPSEFCPRQLQVKLNLDFEDGLESEILDRNSKFEPQSEYVVSRASEPLRECKTL